MQESEDSLPPKSKMSGEGELPGPPVENPDIELEPWQREVVGMHRAILLVHKKASIESIGFNGDDVLAIHRYVLNDPFNPHFSGKLREVVVKIGSTVRGEYREANFIPVHPKDLPGLFAEFSQQLQEKTAAINGSSPISEVLEVASWLHLRLIRLHPFKDGNGRTARLLCDYVFKKAGFPYLTDWGAKDDEYKDVVDRTFKEDDENLFKKFLAEKLIYRTLEVFSMDETLRNPMTSIKNEAEDYLEVLA